MVIKQIDENFGLFTIFLFLLIINISEYFCEYGHEYEIETDFNYPRILRLNNGNYLVMTGSGIYLYNDDFTVKKDIITFGAYLIRNNQYIYSNDMAQFLSEDGGYVICIMLNETYIISKSGDFLYNFGIEYSKLREGNQIIPYGHSGSNYYFVIMKAKDNYIYIRNYTYDSLINRVDYEGCYNYSIGFWVYSYLSCELMKNSNNEKVIFCFFGHWNAIHYVVFDTYEFNPINNYKGRINIQNITGGQLFVTSINSLTRKTLACCTQKVSELNCFGYNIDINNFTTLGQITGGDCKQENINLKIEFFPETEEFFIGCKSETLANRYYLGKLNSNNNFTIYGEYKDVVPNSTCTSTDLFNFIYTSGKYSIVTDSPYCQDRRVVQLIEADKIRDYPSNEPSVIITPPCNGYLTYDTEECHSNIIDGYFYNDTSSNIIYKCHPNCKTCNKSGTDENNNCLTCKDNKIFDLGNCRDNCENGKFFDNNDSIEKCKCTKNISCEYCSKESKEVNLCVTCNNDAGYFKKIDDEERSDGFINCYKNPEGYYLDTDIYKLCYFSCKNCNESGTIKDNKCIECNEGYEFKNDFEKDNNCYNICEYNYYYDSSKNYICTDYDTCPDSFTKLIKEKKRCVDDCNNYDLLEYNNTCLKICPNGTHIKNNICLEDLYCELKEKYYNYEQTKCIDIVTPGYYCNNTSLNTIDKCHFNCKTCEQGGTNDNNNCLTCPDIGAKYFDLGNCRETCNNGYFVENSINKCKCSSNITCQFCSKESTEYNLCDSCNTEKGYYPKYNDDKNIGDFINCYNDTIINCNHYYYFNNSNSKYYCTENASCPDEYNFLIKEKKRCVDNCIKDDNYKYQYENNCYKSCPKNTENSKNNKFICEPCKEENSDSQILLNEVDKLIDNFPVGNISCENNQVKEEDNENYKIYIYINNNCSNSDELPQNMPDIDFGECYNIIKEENEIEEELIVSKVLVKKNNTSVYSFYNPNTLDKLDSTPCKNQTITLQKDFFNIIDNKFDESQKETILHFLNQSINVLNKSDRFYTDLCYYYKSNNRRDIPIKVRLSFYPENITLCEEGCQSVGVDLKTMKAKCECKFIDIMNMNIISDNLYGKAVQEILETISKLNIDVIKCFKDIFNAKYFSKNVGGFIIIGLFLGQISCFIKYAIDGLYYIRKYIFTLTVSYAEYIDRNGNKLKNNVNMPPKKMKKKRSGKSVNILDINNNNLSFSKNGLLHSNNARSRKIFFDSSEKRNSSNNKTQKLLISSNKIVKINKGKPKKNLMLYKNKKIQNNIKITTNEIKKEKINMKEYLSLSFDENDYDDVLEKEKRTFCSYFCGKFKMNQIFINSFFIYEPFRPRSLKILVLIMTIELYFVINAIFYDEEYLTDLYYSKEKDKFYSFIPRRANAFIYTSAVSGIISYFVGYVFVDENKIKKIFRRNKEGDIKMKYEISMMIKDMQNKFTTIIIISFVLTIICFVYISCFNNVYRYIKMEWINSSLFILILMQIINFLMTLIECSFRYIAIKCKSEKLFRLSTIIVL